MSQDQANKKFKINELQPVSSNAYRQSATISTLKQQKQMQENYELAYSYSQNHNVDIDDAYKQFIPEYNKWNNIRLEGYDSKVGDIIKSKKIMICCNSLLKNGLYNDTIGLHINNISNAENIFEPGFERNNYTAVTYNKKHNQFMSHSGDNMNEYGLEHCITLDSKNFNKGYVISAPWKNKKEDLISTLYTTNPILEIRTEDDVLSRYVIPQDYSNSEDNTACVNAEITFKDDMWTVKIRRDFIKGYADNTNLLIQEISKLG